MFQNDKISYKTWNPTSYSNVTGMYSVSQNKVPPNVWFFFSGKSGTVIPKYTGYSKAWFNNRLLEEFRIFQIGSGNTSILLQYHNFAFVQGSVDLVIKEQIFKISNNGMFLTYWLIVMTMNVQESIF